MAYSNKVIDHYENPRNVGSLPKDDPNVGTGLVGAPECGDVMKLQVKVNPETGRHRRRQVQDVRLRLGDRQLEPGHRVAEGQDGRSGARDQEHRHRRRAVAAAGEDPLLGAGRGRDQGGDRRLQEEAGARRSGESTVEQTTQPTRLRRHDRDHRDRREEDPVADGQAGHQRGRSACRRQGRRLLGPELHVRLGARAAAWRRGVRGADGAKIFVDRKSYLFLNGHDARLRHGAAEQGFVFNNPNAKQTCGCGSSFGA